MPEIPRVLTVVGDPNQIGAWSGIPYFFLAGRQRAGVPFRRPVVAAGRLAAPAALLELRSHVAWESTGRLPVFRRLFAAALRPGETAGRRAGRDHQPFSAAAAAAVAARLARELRASSAGTGGFVDKRTRCGASCSWCARSTSAVSSPRRKPAASPVSSVCALACRSWPVASAAFPTRSGTGSATCSRPTLRRVRSPILLQSFVRDRLAYHDLRQRVARSAGEFSWRRTVRDFIALWHGAERLAA